MGVYVMNGWHLEVRFCSLHADVVVVGSINGLRAIIACDSTFRLSSTRGRLLLAHCGPRSPGWLLLWTRRVLGAGARSWLDDRCPAGKPRARSPRPSRRGASRLPPGPPGAGCLGAARLALACLLGPPL